jgi:hypothetical protein
MWARLRRAAQPLMLLTDALDALGQDGAMGSYTAEVPLAAVVGSAARADDFDSDFALVNKALLPRHRRVADTFLKPPRHPRRISGERRRIAGGGAGSVPDRRLSAKSGVRGGPEPQARPCPRARPNYGPQGSGRAPVTVRHVAAHVRHVHVPFGVLRVRLGLTDEYSSLEATRIPVPRSSDDHLRAPYPAASRPAGPLEPSSSRTILASGQEKLKSAPDDHCGPANPSFGSWTRSIRTTRTAGLEDPANNCSDDGHEPDDESQHEDRDHTAILPAPMR